MKRVLVAVNILFLVIITVLACDKKKKIADVAPTYSSVLCTQSPNYSIIAAEGLISANTARMMSLAYRNDNGKRLIQNFSTSSSEQDARAAWFNLETFKNFIWKVENTLCEKGCKDLTLGIRIYYAKYPGYTTMQGRTDLKSVNSLYANHHTLFMVPTYYDAATNTYIDFDPNKMDVKCNPAIAKFNIGDSLNTAMIMMIPLSDPDLSGTGTGAGTGGTTGNIQNHGGLAPPPDNSGTFGDPE